MTTIYGLDLGADTCEVKTGAILFLAWDFLMS